MSKRRRRKSPVPIVIFILAVILITLILILVNRVGLVNVGELFSNAKNLLPKDTPVPIVTEEPVQITVTPVPTPAKTSFPEPKVENSTYNFSASGKTYNGSVVRIAGTGGQDYVKLSELASFFGSNLSLYKSGQAYIFYFNDEKLVFYPEKTSYKVGDKKLSLSTRTILCSNGKDLYVPVDDVLSSLYPAKTVSSVSGTINYSDYDPNFVVQQGRQIPIISYYNVGAGEGPDFRLLHHDSIIPEEFSAQMKYIHDNGYTSMTFEDLAKLESIEKPIMLTFDGCFEDVYKIAWPVLKEYNIKATIFVWPDYIGQSSRLTETQLKKMASSKLISIQPAMESYTMLDYLSKEELISIVNKAKNYVSSLTGKDSLAFAYAVGSVNTMVKDYCASQFRFCVRRSSERPYDTSKDDGSMIYRYTIVRETPLETFALWLSKAK